jgi:hypothetical protein
MVLKNFYVCYNGKKEQIEYETELTFGETEGIINSAIDLSDIQKPKVKIGPFRIQIFLKTLRKAPFSYKSEVFVKALPNNLVNEILDHIMEDYPLVNFLGDWMTSFMGSEGEKESPSEPTPSVPVNSAGPKPKQTSTEPSS